LGSDFGSFGVRTTLNASLDSTPSRSRKRKNDFCADSDRASEREVTPSPRRLARQARMSAPRHSFSMASVPGPP
jgi:hypothetical protein